MMMMKMMILYLTWSGLYTSTSSANVCYGRQLIGPWTWRCNHCYSSGCSWPVCCGRADCKIVWPTKPASSRPHWIAMAGVYLIGIRAFRYTSSMGGVWPIRMWSLHVVVLDIARSRSQWMNCGRLLSASHLLSHRVQLAIALLATLAAMSTMDHVL